MVNCKIQGTGLQGVSKKTAATLKKIIQEVFWTNNSKFLLQAGSNSDYGTQEMELTCHIHTVPFMINCTLYAWHNF